MMLYLLTVIGIFITGSFWYIRKNTRLPVGVDEWIEEIKSEKLPAFMPGRQGFAKNGPVTICFEVMGNSQGSKGSVLLINGHSQTLLSFPPYFYQPLLDAGYQVIRMDNRGLGASSWMNTWNENNAYSLEDMASDAITVLDHLNIEKAQVIGISMGGMIAQILAIRYPQRLQSLTLIMSTGYYYDPEVGGVPAKFYRDFILVNLLYGRDLTKLENKLKLSLAIGRLLMGKGDYDFDNKWILQQAFYENIKRNGYNKKVRDQHSKAIELSGSRYEGLKNLALPTLIIHGTTDPLMPFGHAQKYAAMIPHAKTLFIEGMGHDLPLTHTPKMLKNILDLHRASTPVQLNFLAN